jgi:hypothetical protein
MKKEKIIRKIKKIINQYDTFSIGEVEGADGICINEMGNLIGLVEYFNNSTIEVSVYDSASCSSDAIDEYELRYEELSKDTLEQILFIAELYETDQEKIIKRCEN